MRRSTAPTLVTLSLLATGALAAGTLAACSTETAGLPEPSRVSAAYAYDAMLDYPDAYFPEVVPGADDTFSYSLVDIDGDTIPEMLLRQNGEGERPVVVMHIRDGEVVVAENTLADASGYEGEGETLLFTTSSYPGLAEYRFGATTLTVTGYELHGNRVEQVHGPEETIVGNPLKDSNKVQWLDIEDPAYINALAAAEKTDPLTPPPGQVFTGTFRQYSPESGWRGEDFTAELAYPTITYPGLGCESTLTSTPPDHPGQAGFVERVTAGSCDDGGTWHFIANVDTLQAPETIYARYVAPGNRYVADGYFTLTQH